MENAPLNAGFGRVDITPRLGVRLGGYGLKERPAEEILDNLHSTAMVFEQDGLKAAVINLDWICVDEEIVERIRSDVSARTGIPPSHVTVCATHSHSVPNTLSMHGWGDRELGYIDEVMPSIVRSVELACEDLVEIEAGFATTESLAGVSRRGIQENGKVNFTGSPGDPFDPTMTAVHFRDKAGVCKGIVVHYGAHGTAMGINRIVSRDWCGVMKDRIEPQFKAPVVFLNGAIGDVGPRTNCLQKDGGLGAGGGDGVHSVREVGYRAATDAIRALISIKEWRPSLSLGVHVEDIFIPYAPLMPLAEAESKKVELESKKGEWGGPMCEYGYYRDVIDAWRKPMLKGRGFKQVVTSIGPLALVPMPGEPFSSIVLRIRKGSPYQHTLCCSVANGSIGYMPTREARARGGYEPWVGRAFGAYLLADDSDDALVMENLRVLRNSRKGG